jgi:hypothetical protein
MSRLQKHIQPLTVLEQDHEPQPTWKMAERTRPILASVVGPESRDELPLVCYSAYQWRYNVDESSSWVRRVFFRFVWLPFARFAYFKMGIIPFDRLEPDGSLSWKESQGTFLKEADAVREAAKYPYGGYDEITLDAPESARSVVGRSHFPASSAWLTYERCKEEAAAKDGRIAAIRLREVLRETQSIVDEFRAQRHA